MIVLHRQALQNSLKFSKSVSQNESHFHSKCFAAFKQNSVRQTVCNLSPKSIQQQQIRTTYVVKRKYKLPLKYAFNPQLPIDTGAQIYDLVEDKRKQPLPPIKVILLDNLEDVGCKGEVLEIPNTIGRHALLDGTAVYASPENLKKYTYLFDDSIERPSSKFVATTIKYLKGRVIVVSMNLEHPWQLEPWHVQLGLRKGGVMAPVDAISLDFPAPINGPNLDLENREFVASLMFNKKEKIDIRCRIHHVATDVRNRLPWLQSFWNYATKPVFEEQAETLAKLTLECANLREREDDEDSL